MSSAEFDVLVAGEVNPDLILTGDVVPTFGQAEQLVGTADLEVGSSSAIFACGASRLGLRVAFVGICGDDLFGRFMLERLQARRVNVAHLHSASDQHTGISVILNRGADRAILTFLGSMGALRADDLDDDLLRGARHLHVSSYFLQTGLRPGLPDLFARARGLGLTTSLDTNWDPAQEWNGVLDVLDKTTIFLPNAAEACAIARTPEAAVAASRLAMRAEIVAVKLGSDGALGAQGANIVQVPSFPVTPVDTVGAGDAFDAGFLYGYLQGWKLEKSLRFGAVCGALSTQASGGIEAQPTTEQALRHL